MNNEIKIEKYIYNKYNLVKIDSRKYKKGRHFLALRGNNNHGNEFILKCN